MLITGEMMDLFELLKSKRHAAQITQTEAARLIRIPQSYLSWAENGYVSSVPWHAWEKIAKFYGIKIETLSYWLTRVGYRETRLKTIEMADEQ
jgi:transcriptional regulator with XRE-family HTH domain